MINKDENIDKIDITYSGSNNPSVKSALGPDGSPFTPTDTSEFYSFFVQLTNVDLKEPLELSEVAVKISTAPFVPVDVVLVPLDTIGNPVQRDSVVSVHISSS